MNKSVLKGNVSHNKVLNTRQCWQCIKCPQESVACENFELSKWLIFANKASNFCEVGAYRLSIIKIETTISNCENDHFRGMLGKLFPLIMQLLFDVSTKTRKSS